jgi:hypothetical protein
MEDRVDVLDGLGRHPVAVPEPAVGEQHLVEGVELGGGELLERDRTKRREYAGADVDAVVRERRRPEVMQGRQPPTDQEALKGPLGRLDEGAGTQGRERVVEGRLALPLGLEPALGLLPTSAGDRVDPDINMPGPSGPALVDAASQQSSIRRRGACIDQHSRKARPNRLATQESRQHPGERSVTVPIGVSRSTSR